MDGMDIMKKAHYGDLYTCVATNTYSTAEARSDVVVVGAPDSKFMMSMGFSVNEHLIVDHIN